MGPIIDEPLAENHVPCSEVGDLEGLYLAINVTAPTDHVDPEEPISNQVAG